MNMPLALVVVAVVTLGPTACPDRTIGTVIDDALDNRPAEELQDSVEDAADAVKDATN